MPSLFGGGGPQPSTYSYGGNPAAYIPTGQSAADLAYQNFAGFGAGQGGGMAVPAGQYPQVNPAYQGYQTATGLYGQEAPILSSYMIEPGTIPQYEQGAQNAANYFSGSVFPAFSGAPGNLAGATTTGLGLLPTIMANAQDPIYSQLIAGAANNPYYAQALLGAQTGAGYGGAAAAGAAGGSQYLNQLAPQLAQLGLSAGANINALAPTVAGYGASAAGLAPMAAGYGAAAAGLAPMAAGGAGYLQQLAPELQAQIAAAAQPLKSPAQQILNTAFDPQMSLYNQQLGQAQDVANVQGAISGVGQTPYGASAAANALNNFNLNWQNAQLARQAQGLQAGGAAEQQIAQILAQSGATAAQLEGTAGSLLGTAGGLYGTGISGTEAAGGLYGTAGSLAGQAGNLYTQGLNAPIAGVNAAAGAYGTGLDLGSGASNLAATSAGLPSAAYLGNLESYLPFLQARQNAGLTGTQGFGNLIGAGTQGYTGGLNLGTGLTQGTAAAAGLPYTTDINIGQNTANAFNTLLNQQGSIANLGQGAFNLPQNYLNNLLAYLRQGTAAQPGALEGGQAGFNQLAGGFGGAISGANALFNPNYGLIGNPLDFLYSGAQDFSGGVG